MDWRPMSEAPKDGTAVKLQLEDMDGPYEIAGVWRWTLPRKRWIRDSDRNELMVLPHSWQPADKVLL